MKKIFLTLSILWASVMLSSGQNVTKYYTVGNVNSISAGYCYHIEITEGASEKIEITAPDKTAECLVVKKSNGALVLDLDWSKAPLKNSKGDKGNRTYRMTNGRRVLYGPITVKLQLTDLEKVKLSGAAKLISEGSFKAETLVLKLSGAAKVNTLTTTAKILNADLSGAATASLTGTFEKIDADLSGASKLYSTGGFDSGTFSLSGASVLEMTGENDLGDLKADLSGSTKISAAGTAKEVKLECSGAGRANFENLKAQAVKVELSGASKALIYAEQSLKASISGASKLEYKYTGTPQNLNIQKSGASKAVSF